MAEGEKILRINIEEEMKSAFLNALTELKDRNLEGFLSYCHPQAVFLARDRLFALDRGASDYDEWARDVDQFFSRTISAEIPLPSATTPATAADRASSVAGAMGKMWRGVPAAVCGPQACSRAASGLCRQRIGPGPSAVPLG